MTIKKKLIISFLSITIIPMLVVELLSVYQAKNALEAGQIVKLEVVADLKVDKIESFFSERKADIKTAQDYFNIKSNLPTLIRLVNDPRASDYITAKKRLDGQLQPFQRLKGYLDVMLVNSEGKIVYGTNEDHAGKDLDHPLPDPDGKAFEEGKKGIYFSDIFFNHVAGIPFGMLVTAPIHDFQGKFIGVIALEVDMDSIYQFIQDTTGLGNTGETLIGTKVGEAVLFLNPLRHDKNAALKRRVPIGSQSAFPIQEAVLGRDGSGLSIDYRDEEIIAAWRYIPSLNWGIVAKVDTKEAFASVAYLKKMITVIVGVVLLLVTYIAFVIARSIAKPILSLQSGMEIVGSGNLDHKVGTNARDEIGQLSRIFDRMTENIGKISSSRDALNQELLQVSRKAGMTEMATGLLHNVGNVLNSINVSTEKIDEILQTSKIGGVARAADLLSEHSDDLASFIANDEKGKLLPAYLTKLAEHLDAERADTLDEVKSLTEAVDHVKKIISVQKEFVHSQDFDETVSIPDLLDSVLRIYTMQPDYKAIQLIRDYSEFPPISVQKHKVLQILINLVKNAAQALIQGDGKDKRMTVQTSVIGEKEIQINIIDNGMGIPSEDLVQIFSHGYTTKKDGHGFGLHSAALLAKELGGSLRVDSAGVGQGATFTLTLPLNLPDPREGMSKQFQLVGRHGSAKK